MIIINITNYNQSKYVNMLFDSLFNQVKNADDVVVNWVDDNSTDDSVEVASKHKLASLSNVNIIKHKTNKWVSQSRNESIKQLKENDWITFIDGDDYVADNYISTLREFVEDGEYDVYHFDYKVVCDIPEVNVEDIVKAEDMMVWTRLYRGSFLLDKKIKLKDEPYKDQGFGEDYAFNQDVIDAGAKIKDSSIEIYNYRWGIEGSLSNTHKEREC